MKTRIMMMAVVAMFALSCEQATEAGNAVKDGAEKTGDAIKDAAAASPLANLNGGYSIDPKESKVSWVGTKIGGKHSGTINIAQGKFAISNGAIDKGLVTIDMTSISVSDLEGEDKGKLEGHLKSADFFDIEKFKTAVFNIKESSMEGEKMKLSGDLVIKGKSNPQTILVDVKPSKDKIKLIGDLTFDRAKYDVRYGSGSFFDDLGDKTISDEVNMKFSITASK